MSDYEVFVADDGENGIRPMSHEPLNLEPIRQQLIVLSTAAVRGTGLPDGLPDAVYDWARVLGLQLREAIDKQVEIRELS